MDVALRLGRRGLGTTWPNPAVGAVLVQPNGAGGRIVGRGWTGEGGRPHAETQALARAGEAARGATLYVTLEPCSHWGRTPPCADAVIAAGVARVVACLEDPDPRVAGAGFARLRQAGVTVETGLMADTARQDLAGYLSRAQAGRPRVTLKLAASLDGRIALGDGRSRWITGPAARAWAHLERARHDAVLVGIGTVLADDPELTVRLPGYAAAARRQPLSAVVDARADLPGDSALAKAAGGRPVLLLTGRDAPWRDLERAGVQVRPLPPGPDGRLRPEDCLGALAEAGIGSVLIEGGAAVAASFLKAGLVDRIAWFGAPKLIGGDGLAALGALGLADLEAAGGWCPVERIARDGDTLVILVRGA